MERKVVGLTLLVVWTQLLGNGIEGARTLDRCTLAREMYALGVPKSELSRWAFIADNVSSYRTAAISGLNGDGSRHYGLFQFSNRYWCQTVSGIKSKNICKVNCDQLLTDNIKATVDCAVEVQKMEGWNPWPVISEYDESSTIDDCFEETGNTDNSTATIRVPSEGMFQVHHSVGLACNSKQEF